MPPKKSRALKRAPTKRSKKKSRKPAADKQLEDQVIAAILKALGKA